MGFNPWDFVAVFFKGMGETWVNRQKHGWTERCDYFDSYVNEAISFMIYSFKENQN